MLTTLKSNRSLTFYQQTTLPTSKMSVANAGGISATGIGVVAFDTNTITTGFNRQLNTYLAQSNTARQTLASKTTAYMNNVRSTTPNPTATMLRDKSSWSAVKGQVVREELMKLQISGKTDLPLTPDELDRIRAAIANKDLANMTDKEITELINRIVQDKSQSAQKFMDAFKLLKATGKVSDCLQSAKIEELKKALEEIDLTKITREQFKKLVEKYCEVNEFHHGTSVKADPTKQSDPDNVTVLKTSAHDDKHTDPATGKTDYSKPTEDTPNDRQGDMKKGNFKRVLKNELKGIGLAAAIGVGVGFTIGFVVTLAQMGITPETIKLAAAEGGQAGVESGALAVVGYGIGRTIGEVASKALANTIGNMGVTITENITKMINMGVIGGLTILVFSAYQFMKLKLKGVATREALIQVGKQALFSLSLLAVSIVAQGVWGGAAGIIVSVGVGIIMISYSTMTSVHNRHFAEYIRVYTIEKCRPVFANIQ